VHLPINLPENSSAIRTVASNFSTGRSLEDRQNLNYRVGGDRISDELTRPESDAGLSGAIECVLVPFLLI